jgi:hypothetical protein
MVSFIGCRRWTNVDAPRRPSSGRNRGCFSAGFRWRVRRDPAARTASPPIRVSRLRPQNGGLVAAMYRMDCPGDALRGLVSCLKNGLETRFSFWRDPEARSAATNVCFPPHGCLLPLKQRPPYTTRRASRDSDFAQIPQAASRTQRSGITPTEKET